MACQQERAELVSLLGNPGLSDSNSVAEKAIARVSQLMAGGRAVSRSDRKELQQLVSLMTMCGREAQHNKVASQKRCDARVKQLWEIDAKKKAQAARWNQQPTPSLQVLSDISLSTRELNAQYQLQLREPSAEEEDMPPASYYNTAVADHAPRTAPAILTPSVAAPAVEPAAGGEWDACTGGGWGAAPASSGDWDWKTFTPADPFAVAPVYTGYEARPPGDSVRLLTAGW